MPFLRLLADGFVSELLKTKSGNKLRQAGFRYICGSFGPSSSCAFAEGIRSAAVFRRIATPQLCAKLGSGTLSPGELDVVEIDLSACPVVSYFVRSAMPARTGNS